MAKTIAEQLASEAKGLTFHELPPEVVHQVKRLVLDTVGVGFSGYPSESSQIIQSLIREMNGPAESTVFISGLKTSCLYATLANGAMVRYLEWLDRARIIKEASTIHGHPSESIPPILAVGERQHSTGQEIITVIVSAYELLARFSDSINSVEGNRTLNKLGWKHEMRAPYIVALVVGRLLGLSEEQMANALAIAGCFTVPLGILEQGEYEVTMARNILFSYGAYNGILGALLAQKGFKGPLNVFEGHHGFAEVVLRGKIDLGKLAQRRSDWTILNTWIKGIAADSTLHAHLEGTLNLVKEHDIRPENVAEVKIKINAHVYGRMAKPSGRRYPKNMETAVHSSYYATAVAILDRAVGVDQFSDETRLRDPKVRELSDKVFVEPDPTLEESNSPGIVEITTTKGEKYGCRVDHAKGHPMNPLTDSEIEEKFRSIAGKFVGEPQMMQIVDTIYNLERLDDVGELVKLLVS